jgi:hypothetical protein
MEAKADVSIQLCVAMVNQRLHIPLGTGQRQGADAARRHAMHAYALAVYAPSPERVGGHGVDGFRDFFGACLPTRGSGGVGVAVVVTPVQRLRHYKACARQGGR